MSGLVTTSSRLKQAMLHNLEQLDAGYNMLVIVDINHSSQTSQLRFR